MFFAVSAPICFAAGAMPGTPSIAARSPITNTSGWPGRDRSGCTVTRPARSRGTPRERRPGHAGRPNHRLRRDALVAEGRAVSVYFRDHPADPSGHAEPLELELRLLRKIRRIGAQDAIA